jgi:hypothetical protein
MVVDDKEFQTLLNENQVLKNMIKTLFIFSENAEMTYEAYYKTMTGTISTYKSLVVENKLTDLSIVEKTIEDNQENENKNNSVLG